MTIAQTPMLLSRRLEKRWPGFFRALEEYASGSSQGSLRDKAARLLVFRYGVEIQAAEFEAALLTAVYLWRKKPVVYQFFGAFSDSLNDFCDGMSSSDVLPMEALNQLPAPCLYLYAEDVFSFKAHGCFCFRDLNTFGEQVLYLVFLFSGVDSFPFCIRMKGQVPFQDCLPQMEELLQMAIYPAFHGNRGALMLLSGEVSAQRPYDCPVHNRLLRAIQHCLYLISMNADIQQVPATEVGNQVCLYNVGFNVTPPELEPQQRSSSGDGTGTALKRGHLRRAHWHNYWMKNEAGEKVLTPKWVAAVYVTGAGEGS